MRICGQLSGLFNKAAQARVFAGANYSTKLLACCFVFAPLSTDVPSSLPLKITPFFRPLSAWEAFVDLHDGMGFRLCGTWDLEPPQTAVRTVVMDHILRIVMD